jgi:hypothetical protein
MVKHLTITMVIVFITFALGGSTVINNFAMGQSNTSSTSSLDGNAKMHIDEALKALQSNDNNGATMHLNEASGSTTGTAKMHIDEALKALQSNDNNGATMHTQEAQKNL